MNRKTILELKSWLCWMGVLLVIDLIHDAVKSLINYDIFILLMGTFTALYFIPLFRKQFQKTIVTSSQLDKEKRIS